MAKHVLLNNIEHKDVRIVTQRGAAYGDDVMLAITFPSEFRDLQAHYPIVFRKSADGASFEPVVLFGFQDRENLFLSDAGWDAAYLPLAVERQPFLIGMSDGEPLVHIDMASPRVSRAEGEAIFMAHGSNTDFLEHVNSTLRAIYQGVQTTPAFIAALLEHQLLEAFALDVELDDGSQNRLLGFYTINEEKLNALGGEVIAQMHQAGYLQAIYMALASLSNFRALIERKNRRHA